MPDIYFYTTDGKIVSNYDLETASVIATGNRIDANDIEKIREYASFCRGIKCELKNPTVEDFIKAGSLVKAVKFYHKEHPELTIAESKVVVDKMRKKPDIHACKVLGFCPHDNEKEGYPCVDCSRVTENKNLEAF